MSGLDYLSEREWVIFTIEEELGRLERLVAGGERFGHQDFKILADCRTRLDRVLTTLTNATAEEPLPDWLRRKDALSEEGPSNKQRSA